MLKLLTKIFIKDCENVHNPEVRGAYGTLCSVYGIFLNLVLFAVKFFAGSISGSVAITADAFNNLSDAGSSIITLLGFSIAKKKPDPDHPFGHGRVEYLAGLALSILIIVMGVELAKSSIEKIINPTPVEVSLLSALILVASILVKVYMCIYNRKVGKKINSATMLATSTDSLSDSISTFVVLLSMGIARLFNINIDGWAGLAVAVFICIAGFGAARDTVSPLLGKPPEKELVEEIEKTVLAHKEVLGIHDLLVHDYGPGRLMMSIHAEVDGNKNFFEAHDVIDNIENELREKFNCTATIHLDPVDPSNEEAVLLKEHISEMVKDSIDPSVTIHDLRVVPGSSHTNIIFDLVLPQNFKMSDEKVRKIVCDNVKNNHPGYYAVVNIDHSFT